LACSSPPEKEGKERLDDAGGGERYDERSLGSGGTGGTIALSDASAMAAIEDTRSFSKFASLGEISLPALFLGFPAG